MAVNPVETGRTARRFSGTLDLGFTAAKRARTLVALVAAIMVVPTLVPTATGATSDEYGDEYEYALVASDGATGDKFGASIDADGDTLVVGAPGDDDTGSSSGSAYVYHLVNNKWYEVAKLRGSLVDGGDAFGHTVAVDGPTIVVGAPGSGGNTGRVYVFERTGNNWTETATLSASNAAAGDQFGFSVDVDGDKVAVGAPRKESDDWGGGYVFQRNAPGWSEVQYFPGPSTTLSPHDGYRGPRFGFDVSIDSKTVVFSSPFENRGWSFRTQEAGAVRIYYENTPGSWSLQHYYQNRVEFAGVTPPPWQFGRSIDLEGDLLLVGSPKEAYNGAYGCCWGEFVFMKRSGTSWSVADRWTGQENYAHLGQDVVLQDGTALIGTMHGDSERTGYAISFDATDTSSGPYFRHYPDHPTDPWKPVTVALAPGYYFFGSPNGGGAGGNSGSVAVKHLSIPSPPRNLQAEASTTGGAGIEGTTTIELTWFAPTYRGDSSVTEYNVLRATRSGGPYSHLATVTDRSYSDTITTPGTYYYVVTATNANGWSSTHSNEASERGFAPLATLNGEDGFSRDLYRPESPTGNTPFGGVDVKSPCGCGATRQGSVSMATGEFASTFPVLAPIVERGPGFDLSLTYRSIGMTDGDPQVAAGWHASWLSRIEANGGDYVLHTGDGRLWDFTAQPGGTWNGPPGSYAVLTSSGSGVTIEYADGMRFDYPDATGNRLGSVRDPSGNEWSFVYDAVGGSLGHVVDPHNRQYTLTYRDAASALDNAHFLDHGEPLLTAVTDYVGRTVRLFYDDPTGTLTAIQTPGADGASVEYTWFTYNGTFLETVVDNNNQLYVENTYDAFGRVIAQDQNAGLFGPIDKHLFVYAYAAGQSATRDGAGNDVEWSFDHGTLLAPDLRTVPLTTTQFTHGVREAPYADPDQYVTRTEVNDNDEVTRTVLPRGNVVEYEYADTTDFHAQGNVVRVTRSSGSADDGPLSQGSLVQVTEYEYDPTYNVVTAITDARGTDADYVPQNGGSPTRQRYTTLLYYDFHEDYYGDLNGDGITNRAERLPVYVFHPRVGAFGADPDADLNPDDALGPDAINQRRTETYEWNDDGQLIKYTDPEGVVEQRTYIPSNGVPLDASDAEGFLASIVIDPAGTAATTSYTYTPDGDVATVTDGNGDVTQFTYDVRQRLTQVTGPSPDLLLTKYTYDDNGNLLTQRDQVTPGGSTYATTQYLYDYLDRPTLQRQDATRGTAIDAAIAGQLTQSSTALDTVYRYDGNSNLVSTTDPAGQTTVWTYDERDLLYNETTVHGAQRTWYDDNGNLLAHEDELGHATWFLHDALDRPVARADTLGTVTTRTYDVVDAVVHERIDAAATPTSLTGKPTQAQWDTVLQNAVDLQSEQWFAYDEGGRAYRTDRALFGDADFEAAPDANTLTPGDGRVTTLRVHDAAGRVITDINDNGHATRYTYDALGRLATQQDALGNRVEHTYDAVGNLLQTTAYDVTSSGASAGSRTTQYAHDAYGRVTQVTNADGTTTQTEYDGLGNAVKSIDELGNVAHVLYDRASRPWVTQTELRAGGVGTGALTGTVAATTHWDDAGRAWQRCDDNDFCTRYAFRTSDTQIAQEFSPDGVWIEHGYDAAGNRVYTQFNNGRNITLSYDDLDRLVEVNVLPDPTTIGTTRQTFDHDPMGRVTRMTDNGIQFAGLSTAVSPTVVERSFDSLGRLVSESQNLQTVTYVRDGVGHVLSTEYPNGRVVERSHDELGRLSTVEDAKGFIAGLDYEGGRIVEKRFGADASPVATTHFDFDAMRRITDVDHRDGAGNLLVGLDVRYDAAGHRVAQDLSPDPANVFDELLQLDSLYRTASWKRGDLDATLATISNVQETQAWNLDGANNWDSHDRDGTTCTRTHNAGNQVTSESCGGSSESFAYDPNGNLAEDDDFAYHYDFLNRLVRVDDKTLDDPLLVFGYDAIGRRIVKVVNEQQFSIDGLGPRLPVHTLYTYDGANVIQESQPLRFNGDILSPDIRVIRQWTHGDGVDDLLAMTVDGDRDGATTGTDDERYFYHYDAHGSVIGLSDEDGDLVEGYTYDPFGKPTIRRPGSGFDSVQWTSSDDVVTTGASHTSNPFLFNGRYWDAHMSMYHQRARTYDPEMGRFINRDPIGIWGDLANLGNAYAYVGNSPWQYSDPYGLCSWKVYDCVADGLRFIGEGTINTVGKATAESIWYVRDEVFDSSAEEANAAICQGGSGLAASFAPGVSTGCALGNDFGDDGVIGNQKEYHADYALAPLDVIPGGRATNGAVALGVFATKHVDEAVATGRNADDGVDWIRQVAKNLDDAGPRLAAGADFRPGMATFKSSKHGSEWTPALHEDAYVSRARDLLSRPPGEPIETFIRHNGDTLRYDRATNEFISVGADGTIKTMFRPNQGAKYWQGPGGKGWG